VGAWLSLLAVLPLFRRKLASGPGAPASGRAENGGKPPLSKGGTLTRLATLAVGERFLGIGLVPLPRPAEPAGEGGARPALSLAGAGRVRGFFRTFNNPACSAAPEIV
jgi:hypothetical protein